MRSYHSETVKCETHKTRQEAKTKEALNWQRRPLLPAGTVVCLELGMSLANQL